MKKKHRNGAGSESDDGATRRPADDDGARDASVLDAASLLPRVYDQLRALAAGYMSRERRDHTLQPTALVHEAYLRIARDDDRWNSKTHFLAVAAIQMRRVLMQYARGRAAQKRGTRLMRVSLSDDLIAGGHDPVDWIAFDDALRRLEERSPRQARVAEMRLLAGMTSVEVAEALGVSERTAKRDWLVARAWIAKELQ